MKLAQARRSGRRGFTLVELMVVIAIIALLISMLTAAVWKALVTTNRVKLQNEISQLTTAVQNFYSKFGIYPPSRIILCESYDFYFVGNNHNSGQFKSDLHQDSVTFLQQIWPRITFDFLNRPGLAPRWVGIDWDGNGKLTPGEVLLEGDQCLVFFLGGIPGRDANNIPFTSGFSTNPQNPAYHTASNAPGSEVVAPFFEFSSDRLKILPQRVSYILPKDPSLTVSSAHYSYLDTYRVAPYAYFSSFKSRNDYNHYAKSLIVRGTSGSLLSSDCTSLFVWPYAEALPTSTTAPRYHNPNTFQIISAGADGQFGRGSDLNGYPQTPTAIWAPAAAGNTAATSVHWNYFGNKSAGIDDQSNFYDTTLGTGN